MDWDAAAETNDVDWLVAQIFQPEGAEIWMRSPNPLLDGQVPNDLAQSAAGRERVASLLLALAEGAVF